MNKKTTKREHFLQLADILSIAEQEKIEIEYSYDELQEFINKELDLLDKKADAAKARAAKQKAEGDELRERVKACLSTEGFTTIKEIADALNDEEITAQKITARLTQLVKLGEVEKSMVENQNAEGKKVKKTGYRLLV